MIIFVDVVIICIFNYIYVDIVWVFLRVGVYLFIEKLFCFDMEDGVLLVVEFKVVDDERGVKFFVGYYRCFNFYIIVVKKVLDGGLLGFIIVVNVFWIL